MNQPNFNALADRFRLPWVRAIVLMGSCARGDVGSFSDVDLVRFARHDADVPPDPDLHLVECRLVVVSNVTPSKVNACFTYPFLVTEYLAGLRYGKPLWDPEGYFRDIQERARAFVWESSMQEKANVWASRQLIEWIEEVYKGLEGLRTHDMGRLLNARYGLSWGLTKVMRVQRGVLLSSDNGSYPEVIASLGRNSEWAELSRRVFGIEITLNLEEQVRAGLQLYVLTARMLKDVLMPDHRQIIHETIQRIQTELLGLDSLGTLRQHGGEYGA